MSATLEQSFCYPGCREYQVEVQPITTAMGFLNYSFIGCLVTVYGLPDRFGPPARTWTYLVLYQGDEEPLVLQYAAAGTQGLIQLGEKPEGEARRQVILEYVALRLGPIEEHRYPPARQGR